MLEFFINHRGKAWTRHEHCLMIGIIANFQIFLGAINAGIDQVYFNPEGKQIDLNLPTLLPFKGIGRLTLDPSVSKIT